jgi:hypothetical protein
LPRKASNDEADVRYFAAKDAPNKASSNAHFCLRVVRP